MKKGGIRWTEHEAGEIAAKILEMKVQKPSMKYNTEVLREAQKVLPINRQRADVEWVSAKQVRRIVLTGKMLKEKESKPEKKIDLSALADVTMATARAHIKNAQRPSPVVVTKPPAPASIGFPPPGLTREVMVQHASNFLTDVVLQVFRNLKKHPEVSGLLQLIAPPQSVASPAPVEVRLPPPPAPVEVPQARETAPPVDSKPPVLPITPSAVVKPSVAAPVEPAGPLEPRRWLIIGIPTHHHAELLKAASGKLDLKFWTDAGRSIAKDKIDWTEKVLFQTGDRKCDTVTMLLRMGKPYHAVNDGFIHVKRFVENIRKSS